MVLKVPNYYVVLGIQRSASADEVRKAFRRMAQKYHPDINRLPYAEERFKQINEAYEVLSDPEKRKKYDREAYPFHTTDKNTHRKPNESFRSSEQNNNGAFEREEHSGRFSKFFESFFNSAKKARDSFFARAYAHPQRGSDLVAELEVTLEELYHGEIKHFELLINHKNRLGKMVVKKKKYELKIPPGTRDGTCIRLRGQGNNGQKGGSAGDLFIKINLLSHPHITVKEYDLLVDMPVAPYEAALGSWVQVPTLAGSMSIRLPAGTSSGKRMRLRGKGLPKKNGTHGDLYINFVIAIPTRLTDSERRIYQALARVSKMNPRNES